MDKKEKGNFKFELHIAPECYYFFFLGMSVIETTVRLPFHVKRKKKEKCDAMLLCEYVSREPVPRLFAL